ncbi:MAG TPA: DUF3108 domain-containing protein [Clostridia bacterium]|nr:DUF3108 domain-containing protein [Clostridia bacterium]
MLKKTAIFLILTVILSLTTALPAAAPAQASRAPANSPKVSRDTIGPVSHVRPAPDKFRFPNGQTLHYAAEWRLWTAGTATLRMDGSGNEQRVTGTADSAGFVALLYRVADRFESYFDRRSFCSLRINKHTEEGLHRRDTQIRFDAGRRKAVLDERNLKTGTTKHTEEDIPGCVTDVLSAIFYVGSLQLEPGSTYTFPLNDGGKTVDVRAHVEAREEIKTDAGTFKTVRVQPEAESGVLKSRGKVWVWYTDDASHIPVQMRARLFWGTLTFRLTRVERP